MDFLTDSEADDLSLGAGKILKQCVVRISHLDLFLEGSLSSGVLLDSLPHGSHVETDFSTNGEPITTVTTIRKSLAAPTSLLFSVSTETSSPSPDDRKVRKISEESGL